MPTDAQKTAYFKKKLKESGMTQATVAEKAFLDASAVSRLSTGSARVSESTFHTLIDVVGGTEEGFSAFCAQDDALSKAVEAAGIEPDYVSYVKDQLAAQQKRHQDEVARIEGRYQAMLDEIKQSCEERVSAFQRMADEATARARRAERSKNVFLALFVLGLLLVAAQWVLDAVNGNIGIIRYGLRLPSGSSKLNL